MCVPPCDLIQWLLHGLPARLSSPSEQERWDGMSRRAKFKGSDDARASAPHHWRLPDAARCQLLAAGSMPILPAVASRRSSSVPYSLDRHRDLLRRDGAEVEPGRLDA